jgi:tetratricopeptide (TPR) repeat protein/TolB-like protein
MSRVFSAAALVALMAPYAGAQFPRLAPPPPCRATVNGGVPAYLGYWAATRDGRPKIAVFAMDANVDDASRVYLANALPERIRERLSASPRLRVATEGSVARAMTDARARSDSAAILLRADYIITGRLLILGQRQEVEMVLQRPGQAAPVWQASFRATTSLRAVEEAIVRGLSRALGLPSTPAMEKGWPANDAAHAAILAGDALMRSPNRATTDSALMMYEEALEQEPGSAVAAARLARASVIVLERGGEIPGYPGAAGPRRVNDLVSQALEGDSTAEAWTIRAMLARYMDPVRFAGALDAHLRAVSLDPTDSDAEHEYGVTLLRLGDLRGAETHFRRALTLMPGRSDTFAMLAWMDLQASRWESACLLSNASIAAWPFDPVPYSIRAEARLHLADTRDAFSDSELVRRLASGAWPDALRVLIANGASNVEEARRQIMGLTAAWLAPGIQFSIRDAEYLAFAYLTMGDRRRAIEALRRARPMGADLRVALRSPRLAAIRGDTAIVRMIAESEGRYRE